MLLRKQQRIDTNLLCDVENTTNSISSGTSGEPMEGFHPFPANYYYEDKLTTNVELDSIKEVSACSLLTNRIILHAPWHDRFP